MLQQNNSSQNFHKMPLVLCQVFFRLMHSPAPSQQQSRSGANLCAHISYCKHSRDICLRLFPGHNIAAVIRVSCLLPALAGFLPTLINSPSRSRLVSSPSLHILQTHAGKLVSMKQLCDCAVPAKFHILRPLKRLMINPRWLQRISSVDYNNFFWQCGLKSASAAAEFPPPTTATVFPLKNIPSQAAQ